MAKTFICTLAFVVVSTFAHAQSVGVAQPDLAVSHPHNYWLSDGLNRLVFWQTPLKTGRSVAPSRPADATH